MWGPLQALGTPLGMQPALDVESKGHLKGLGVIGTETGGSLVLGLVQLQESNPESDLSQALRGGSGSAAGLGVRTKDVGRRATPGRDDQSDGEVRTGFICAWRLDYGSG